MKMYQILSEESKDFVQGTNCGNCTFTKDTDIENVDQNDLNENGGLNIIDKNDLDNAKNADLVTLPGEGKANNKLFCQHKDVQQWVTNRMCCAFWDNPGCIRDFGKKVVGK